MIQIFLQVTPSSKSSDFAPLESNEDKWAWERSSEFWTLMAEISKDTNERYQILYFFENVFLSFLGNIDLSVIWSK